MKILYLANIRFPTEKAHGIQIAKMCESFALSHEIKLIIPWRFNYIKENTFQYYNIKKNFNIKKVFSLDIIFLHIPKISFLVQSLSFFVFIFIYIFFEKTDVIYTRDVLLARLLSCFKKNIFLELHSLSNQINKKNLKNIKGIIVINKILKNKLIKKNINKNKILIAQDGVDIKQFNIKISKKNARKKLSLPIDKKIIGYVGQLTTLEKTKGIDYLIKAVKKLNNPLLTLCLVGGKDKDIIKYKKLALKANINILFIGQVSYNLIPYYLKSFDVLVMPFPWTKHYAYYMSPLKMFEYMASKRPIIASNLPSVREILNKNNAILVKPDSFKHLSEGIKKALIRPGRTKQAFKDVRKYTWLSRTEKIIKFIHQ